MNKYLYKTVRCVLGMKLHQFLQQMRRSMNLLHSTERNRSYPA